MRSTVSHQTYTVEDSRGHSGSFTALKQLPLLPAFVLGMFITGSANKNRMRKQDLYPECFPAWKNWNQMLAEGITRSCSVTLFSEILVNTLHTGLIHHEINAYWVNVGCSAFFQNTKMLIYVKSKHQINDFSCFIWPTFKIRNQLALMWDRGNQIHTANVPQLDNLLVKDVPWSLMFRNFLDDRCRLLVFTRTSEMLHTKIVCQVF